jgi:hypothetical protein
MKISRTWLLAAILACAIAAGCGGSAGLPPSSARLSTGASLARELGFRNAANDPGHLYVADSNGVERFPISNGVLKLPPDLKYSGVGAPIAIGPSGDLYATSYPQMYPATIAVFRKDSTRRIRTLNVSIKGCNTFFKCVQGPVSALLVAQGHLFVGYQHTECSRGRSGFYCYRDFLVLVFAANARGHAKRLKQITVSSCSWRLAGPGCGAGQVAGLALDNEGDLLVSLFWQFGSQSFGWNDYSDVRAYTLQGRKKTPVRTLTGSGVAFPNGLAADTSDELYVDNPAYSGFNPTGKAFIAAYPATANGSPPPDREIMVKDAQFGSGIAVSPLNLLYVPDPTNNVVYELHSDRNGTQRPTSTLSVSAPEDVKLGP